MSKIGRSLVDLYGANVQIEKNSIKVSGKNGVVHLHHSVDDFNIEIKNDKLSVVPKTDDVGPMWGTITSLLKNACYGVGNKKYEKKIKLCGTGLKAVIEGNNLLCYLGFGHPCSLEIPKDLEISLSSDTKAGALNYITIRGCDKHLVGHFTDRISKLKPFNPYNIQIRIINDGNGEPRAYYEKETKKKK
jgi:large subunit ribosomal protein L6